MKPLIALVLMTSLEGFAQQPNAEVEPKPRDERLAREINRRADRDQAARAKFIKFLAGGKMTPEAEAAAKGMEKIDAENTAWLEKLVNRRGWPTISLVGKEGAKNAWLLVQHADKQPKFQRRCLDLMKPLLGVKEVMPVEFAYLTDRVLEAEGKKQLFGTQAVSDGKGGFTIKPCEDPDNLDKRRAEIGMEPIAEYIKTLEKIYGKSGG